MDAGRRIVLVHDWLTGMRGGEKCLDALARRWPDARLFTLLHAKGKLSPAIEQLRPQTSFLQRLPGITQHYRYLLPTFPLAARWRIPPCAVVLSLSHCVAKAALPPLGVPHVCYCFTPMRYAWHLRDAYFGGRLGRAPAAVLGALLAGLRRWDKAVSERVTHFVAISQTIRQRIRECYGRDSRVVYPPIDTDFYRPAPVPRDDYYLAVSAFAPYKRLDLAITACNRLRRKLVIIGSGQDDSRLRSLAGPTIQFLGWQTDDVIRDHYRRCRALLFPGEEDFGLVPVEAQACGAPVIAFGRGGVTESVIDGATGLFFAEQTAEALIDALERADRADFSLLACRRQALHFRTERFVEEMEQVVEDVTQARPVRRAA